VTFSPDLRKNKLETLTGRVVGRPRPAVGFRETLKRRKEHAADDDFKIAIHGLLAILALGTCAWGADEQFNWSGIVAPGQTVEIRNINGTVRADAGSGTQVEVSAGEDREQE